jgi:hypothetical protein
MTEKEINNLKKRIHQVYLLYLKEYDLRQQFIDQCSDQIDNDDLNNPYSDPNLKVLSEIQRNERIVYKKFGFYRNGFWLCESHYNIEQMFEKFCDDPERLIELYNRIAINLYSSPVKTFTQWIRTAPALGFELSDIPTVLHKRIFGRFEDFMWQLFVSGKISAEELVKDFEALKRRRRDLAKFKDYGDGGATKALLLEVKYYRSFIRTLPNREERIELEKKKLGRIFKKNGIEKDLDFLDNLFD